MARRVEKREFIERGVVEVVARKGLSGTTIQDIAAAANVSPGLLYRYWKNRDALAGEVYRTHYEALMTRLLGSAAIQTHAWHRLEAMLREFLRFAQERPVILRFLLLSQHDLVNDIPAELGIRRLLVQVFDQGMKTGAIRSMPVALAIHFALGVVLQPVIGAIYGHIDGPVTHYADEILAALRRVLSPDRESP